MRYDKYMQSHRQLVQFLQRRGVLQTPAIIAAFSAIDRRDFVPPDLIGEAYSDIPLPLGLGQTISQPYTVAYMLELLQPHVGENILDIGSGSGWQTALLAHIVGDHGHVTALEIISELCERGRQNVAKYNFLEKGIVEMHCMSGLRGYPSRAPFDKIIAAAAGETVPEAWLAQTNIGGQIVLPIGSSVLQLIKKSDSEWERHDHPGFVFVPLVSEK